MKLEDLNRTVERVRRGLVDELEYSIRTFGPLIGWTIAPCPSYFDSGDDHAYGLYPVHAAGDGWDIFLSDGPAAMWDCLQVAEELGLEDVRMSPDQRYVGGLI